MFCYTMRFSMTTMESIKSMFYEFADRMTRYVYKVSQEYKNIRLQLQVRPREDGEELIMCED